MSDFEAVPEQARNLADEQVGETVPGPIWLYPRHVDAVRPLRTQGAQNIRTRGSLPQQRSNIRTWLAVAHHQFSACRSGGVHIGIYADALEAFPGVRSGYEVVRRKNRLQGTRSGRAPGRVPA